MTRDSELNDAYGLIVDLKADKVRLVTQIEALEKYARHKAACPVSLAWGKGPGGTGIECDCGFAALAAKKLPR